MQKIIVISGPTASGKSSLAQTIYDSGENFAIVNADSMQLYKELPILTAQPNYQQLPDYHLYGVLSYDQPCSVVIWLNLVKSTISNLHATGKTPLIVGGTGLYIKSLIYGLSDLPDITPEIRTDIRQLFDQIGIEQFYQLLTEKDPLASSRIRSSDRYRMIRAMEVFSQTGKSIIEFYGISARHCKECNNDVFTHLTISPPRQTLYDSCNTRFEQMLSGGALDEVERFSKLPDFANSLLAKALGYNSLRKYLANEISLEQAKDEARAQTRQYAKRQITWFKHQAPEAVVIHSHDYNSSLTPTSCSHSPAKIISNFSVRATLPDPQ